MKTIKFLSMAALAMVGAVISGCSSSSDFDETPAQPASTGNTETLTINVSMDGGDTRALDIDFVNKKAEKTFAVGEQLALVYKNTSGNTVKTVSAELVAGDITNEGKNATFTFELTDPDKTQNVSYIYPAVMANNDGTVLYPWLWVGQNGTLDNISSTYDVATYSAAWDGTSLPSGTLENQLAILALTLKNADGSSIITSGLRNVTIGVDEFDEYVIEPQYSTFGEDVIYVAIQPVTTSFEITATDGINNYTKTTTSREYAAGNFYNLALRMPRSSRTIDLANVYENMTLEDGDVLTGTLSEKVKISIADGATVTLDDATIEGTNESGCKWAGITCLGDATIILKYGTNNTVTGFYTDYPGIYVPSGKTLTIKGDGWLTARSNGDWAAGIGGGNQINCGNIVIEGGEITATATYAACIGGGCEGNCGNITIKNTVSQVSVSRSTSDGHIIGKSYNGSCGTVTICDQVLWDGSAYQNNGESHLEQTFWTFWPKWGGI